MTLAQTRGGDVLAGRYTPTEPVLGGVQLLVAHDEVLDRDVSLLLLPGSSGIGDRLALRLQLLSALEHPHLAQAFDVVAASGQLGVVLRLLPGAVLLSSLAPERACARVGEQVRDALAALHAAGRAHGSVSTDAVAVLPDGSGVLLPLPARPGALPDEDLRALARAFPDPATQAVPVGPPDRTVALDRALLEAPTTLLPVAVPPAPADRAPVTPPVTAQPAAAEPVTSPRAAGRPPGRTALIAAGGFGGALLADLLSRMLG